MYDARHLHLAVAKPSAETEQLQQLEGAAADGRKGAHEDTRAGMLRSSTSSSTSDTMVAAASGASGMVSIKVMWATWNATVASVVEYGKSSDQDGSSTLHTQIVTGRSYSFPMDVKHPSRLQWEHVALLDDLEPGVLYRYRPGQGPTGRDFSNSSWRTFNAPHPAGSKQAAAKATAFFVLADMGADESDGGQTTAAIAAELKTNASEFLGGTGAKYESLIHAGDICTRAPNWVVGDISLCT